MLISIAQAQLFFLALTRIMAMIIHVPVLGGQNIPNQVRIGLGLILAAILLPWQPLAPDAASLDLLGFGAAIFKEVLVGTLAGFAAALTFGAMQIAGEAMGTGSGFGSSRVFNPAMGDSGSSYNQFFVMIAMLIFLLVDGHHVFIAALERTFQVVPLNSAIPLDSMETLIKMSAQLLAAGIHLALPVMAALFLTDLALGLLARVAPQIQVFFLGLPVKVGVSLAALGLALTLAIPALNNMYQSMGGRMLQLLGR